MPSSVSSATRQALLFARTFATPGSVLEEGDETPEVPDASAGEEENPLPLPPEDTRPRPGPIPDLPVSDRPLHRRGIHRLRFRPKSVPLAPQWHYHFRSAVKNDHLILKKVNGVHIAALTKQQLADMLASISSVRVKARWHRGAEEAPPREHFLHMFRSKKRAKISGASALALRMLASQHPEQARRIVKLRPVDVANDIGPLAPSLFPVDTLESVIRKLIPDITHADHSYGHAYALSGACGNMVHAFLDEHAKDDPASIEGALIHLLVRLEQSGFETTTPNLGALAGIIFAGGLKHSKALKKSDEKRYNRINKAVLLVFAATLIIPINISINGAIATTGVIIGIILERVYKIRDLSEFINELEGKLRLGLLKQEVFSSQYEFTTLMGWVDTMILCNGMR